MVLAVVRRPGPLLLIGLRIEDPHLVRAGHGDRGGAGADDPVDVLGILRSRKAALLLGRSGAVIELIAGFHPPAAHADDGELTVQALHLHRDIALLEVHHAQALGQGAGHIQDGGHGAGHRDHQRGLIAHHILHRRDVIVELLQDVVLCGGVLIARPLLGDAQAGDLAVAVCVDLRDHLGALELAHDLGCGHHEVGLVDLVLIEGELAASVLGHLLGLPLQVDRTLHKALVAVIVGQAVHVHAGDLHLRAAVVAH